METLFALVGMTVIAVGALVALVFREQAHARELRELATIALTQKYAETVDDSVRAVALTREALSSVPPVAQEPVVQEVGMPTTGFTSADGTKLEFATPFPHEMIASLPQNRRLHR